MININFLLISRHAFKWPGFVVKVQGGNEFPCLSPRNNDIIYGSGDFMIELATNDSNCRQGDERHMMQTASG